ncbi:SURF1 family protein [Rhodoferax sp.]|uniref:SURF1 family protein n=1 Tax=Rhodoferax sp. TaxID=50421 RepID=UPI00284B7F23|nr:SURF1 family protein [Rhodoferax sp.]MDR3371167.1 SURF1 family protein [Rhodoferax sp.]
MTVTAVLAVVATFSLGRWQLSRAAQKEALQAHRDAQTGLDRLDGRTLASLADPSLMLDREVALRGTWIAQQLVFLDNRQMHDKQGFYVVTPLQLQDSAGVILVQRGWVARNFLDRTAVPEVPTPKGTVDIVGRIVPPPSKLYELGAEQPGRIRQNLDLVKFRAETGLPLLTAVSVQQIGTASDGLLRDWPRLATGVEKHYGYAFQWFALSALITILYVWFQVVKRFIFPRRT